MNYSGFRLAIQPKQRPTHAGFFAKTNRKNSARLSQQHWGESVVAGLVSPDHFIVDKVGRKVVDKKLGAKQVSIWLVPDGGTIERRGHRSAELTLSEAQLNELTDVICRIVDACLPPLSVLIQVLLGLDLVTREQGMVLGAAFLALLAAGVSSAFVNGFDRVSQDDQACTC